MILEHAHNLLLKGGFRHSVNKFWRLKRIGVLSTP